ncbi:hypothetical protein CHCC14431_2436 [Bacillus licheniformis]|nr:hypothetical protein CHCC14596_4360 [Bacillus licheniformis]TWO10638.1 hypothetical protein CHCC14431_2436 [Bacillus licheniformis]
MNIEGIEMKVRSTGDVCSDALEFLRRHNCEKTAEHSIRVKKRRKHWQIVFMFLHKKLV